MIRKVDLKLRVSFTIIFIFFVLVAIALNVFSLQDQSFPNEIRMALDGQIQSMSMNAPFVYEIKSARRSIDSPNSLDGWCVTIAPSLQMYLQPSGSLSLISHFFISKGVFTFDGLRFEDTQNDRERWSGIGCGDW